MAVIVDASDGTQHVFDIPGCWIKRTLPDHPAGTVSVWSLDDEGCEFLEAIFAPGSWFRVYYGSAEPRSGEEDRDDLRAALNAALKLPSEGTVDLEDAKRDLGLEP